MLHAAGEHLSFVKLLDGGSLSTIHHICLTRSLPLEKIRMCARLRCDKQTAYMTALSLNVPTRATVKLKVARFV